MIRALSALLLTCSVLHAGDEATVGVDLSLVTEHTAITPGKPFTVALKVRHHEGYHTYWKNPGIVGVPLSLAWTLPPGFTAGPIQWPTPQQVMMAKYPAHGFKRDILLLVDIQPPAEISGTKVSLTATASWMACAAGCYPGKKVLPLEIGVSSTPSPAPEAAAIAAARATLPAPLTGWTTKVESAKDAPEIRIRFIRDSSNPADPGKPYFFSEDGQISSDPPQKVETLPDGFRIVAPRDSNGPKGIPTLPGVILTGNPLSSGGPNAATLNPSYPAK